MECEPIIGLEIHAQLLTRTKIFCACPTTFGSPPNTNVCAVCLGLPGALPVLNAGAVALAMRAALALGCEVQGHSVFARKNYFYPDLPKGYQISQYERPLATSGRLEYEVDEGTRRVGITRLHLEEDAGKLLHEGFRDSDRMSYVDFNRSGVPLVEIVTEPDLRSGASAADFFERLRAILVALEVNDGNMEEGSLRCDANVSVRPRGQEALGAKVEIKNLNSFRFLQRALEYEIERQTDVLRGRGRVEQETRLWDAAGGRTHSMRSKEDAHDYRYFPEPDLPPVIMTAADVAAAAAALPELPEARRRRLIDAYGLAPADAVTLAQSAAVTAYFEATAVAAGDGRAAANWILGDLSRKMNALGIGIENVRLTPEALGQLVRMVGDGAITGPTAKAVFETMYGDGRSPRAIVEAEGLGQIDDENELVRVIDAVLANHPGPVTQYRGGKKTTMGFLVGQVMRVTTGKANPVRVNELLRSRLEAPMEEGSGG